MAACVDRCREPCAEARAAHEGAGTKALSRITAHITALGRPTVRRISSHPGFMTTEADEIID